MQGLQQLKADEQAKKEHEVAREKEKSIQKPLMITWLLPMKRKSIPMMTMYRITSIFWLILRSGNWKKPQRESFT